MFFHLKYITILTIDIFFVEKLLPFKFTKETIKVRFVKKTSMNNLELIKIASQVRRDIVRMVSNVSSGHPGGSLGCADFLTLLGLKWGSRRASGCKTLEKIDVSYAATSNIDAVTRGRVWFSLAPELTDKAH